MKDLAAWKAQQEQETREQLEKEARKAERGEKKRAREHRRAQKKHKQKRNDMLMSISKYTEITTIGGICGTVVEIETTTVEDDAEPVPTHFLLEVDASSGSRLRIVAEAVGRVVDNTEEEA